MSEKTSNAALREAAKRATPGPWSVARDGSVISNQCHPLATVSDGFHRLRSDGETGQDAEFIALANPATILSLLGQLEAERQRADASHKYASERDAENESLMLTVGRLRKELSALKTDIESYISINGELATELEALKDERPPK